MDHPRLELIVEAIAKPNLEMLIEALGSRFKRLQRCEASAMLSATLPVPGPSWICWYETSTGVIPTKPQSNPMDALLVALSENK